jgi:probable DNA repair protein
MGQTPTIEIDAWLRDGGLVVTASDRAARALASAFHRSRRAEGLSAWPAPNILDWKSFVRTAWEERSLDARSVLNPTQEQAIWAGIAGESRHLATLLEGPRHRLAALAMEAHSLLSSFAPRYLKNTVRSTWQQDAAAFSGWLTEFDELCSKGSFLSPSRVPLELIRLLEADPVVRPPLLLAGFDRLLPIQRSLFDAWGEWREAPHGEPTGQISFHDAANEQTELAACALWCSRQLAASPGIRLMVVTQDATSRRGELERAFIQYAAPASPAGPTSLPFEFSLGVPLSQAALAHAAYLLLHWLDAPLQEQELDWLLSTGHLSASAEESLALQALMRALRRRGRQQTHWTLAEFLAQHSSSNPLPPAWVERIALARSRLENLSRRPQSPLDWSAVVAQILEAAGWPGFRPLSSAEFQAAHRWQLALETAGSLGFDGRRIPWREFLATLHRTLDETLFAAESHDAPIQIAGPAESAGLAADAIWCLGASEDSWPAKGATHPLLPPEVQRQAGMPHATPQLDWELARAMTTRLLASAPEVHFSFARQSKAADARPSRLVVQVAGPPRQLPPELLAQPAHSPLTVQVADTCRIPFPPGEAAGGSSVLTSQSQCPFKAFATARLAAQSWEPAQAGLTASQRGQLLHAVLHAIWAGPPHGIRTHGDLLQKLEACGPFVAEHVHRVLADEIPDALRSRMPRRYLELEELRLTRLVTEWLNYEASRWPFAVAEAEVDSTITIAGLTLKLRLDRVDRLNDGTLLVIDYKTGDVSPKSWELPRPDDVQLPLYAGFAIDRTKQELGGLVFAKIRAGSHAFAGQVGDAKATLLEGLSPNSALIKNPLTAEQLLGWRDCIQQLAKDFVAGHAQVDPREYPRTCERCDLKTLCRIQENRAQFESDDDSESQEAADE